MSMSDNSGQYKSEIFQVGTLSGLAGDLYNGSVFQHPPLRFGEPAGQLDFNPGVGNRVVLYIADLISAETRENPFLFEFGIYVTWSFYGKVPGDREDADSGGDVTYRILSNGFDPQSPSILDPRRQWWQEAKVDYYDSPFNAPPSLNGPDLQLGEMRYNYYKFPVGNQYFGYEGPGPNPGATEPNIFRVISMTARGDFMRVFWYDHKNIFFPGYTLADLVEIWAMRGQDAPGSVLSGSHVERPAEG